MRVRRLVTLTTLVMALVARPPQANAQEKIYWVETAPASVRRANQDGSNVELLVDADLGMPDGIALDVVAGRVYWTDRGTNKIQRANLDGTNVEDFVNAVNESRIALDIAGGKIYWTHNPPSDTRKIRRANLEIPAGETADNRTDIEDLVTGLSGTLGIAVDATGGKMYWADFGAAKIQRANLDGSNIEDLVVTTFDSTPYSLALDLGGGKMYWMAAGGDFALNPKIKRANLDGSNIEVVLGLDLADFGLGIAVDPVVSKLYWSLSVDRSIRRANLDGSEVETILQTGSATPQGIALDVRPIPIPTVSQWGAVAMIGLLLATGHIIIRRRAVRP